MNLDVIINLVAPQRERYLLPAIASILVAGSGQIMKGEGKRGLKMMVWFYMGLPIITVGMFMLNPYVFLMAFAAIVVIYPVFWFYNIVDAYSSGVALRRRR